MTQRYYLDFYGRVQNCGFRWHCRQCAGTAGVTGWAENDPYDSSHVSCEVQGTPEAISLFLDLVQQGNGYSRVELVERQEIKPRALELRFSCR